MVHKVVRFFFQYISFIVILHKEIGFFKSRILVVIFYKYGDYSIFSFYLAIYFLMVGSKAQKSYGQAVLIMVELCSFN